MKSFLQTLFSREPVISDIYNHRPSLPPMIPPPPLEEPATPDLFPKECPSPATIKHLVIAGGGECGFAFYSALRESNKAGFWKRENIESIYCTSAGSMIAILIALLLQFDWDTYDEFMLKRPWNQVFHFNINRLIQSIKQKGIFGIKTISDIFYPIFGAVDIPIDISLKEFREITGVDIHIISTELNQLEMVDISNTTHPDWKLIDAVYCSACLPILFIPHDIENKMYIDGGIVSNYPINVCLGNGCSPEETLGLTRVYNIKSNQSKIDTLMDYMFYIIAVLLSKCVILPTKIKNQIEIERGSSFVNVYDVYKLGVDYHYRVSLFEEGVAAWRDFYAKTYLEPAAEIDAEPSI